jgi:amino-acid N-acetyltransferase
MPLEVEGARAHDLPAALELLRRANLPEEGVVEQFGNYFAVRDDVRLVGLAGLEVHGPDGLLRSLVVDPQYRGEGVGERLLDFALALARKMELAGVYLLTTTAHDYFQKRGFADWPREQAPAGIRDAWEFKAGCPQQAAFMKLAL